MVTMGHHSSLSRNLCSAVEVFLRLASSRYIAGDLHGQHQARRASAALREIDELVMSWIGNAEILARITCGTVIGRAGAIAAAMMQVP